VHGIVRQRNLKEGSDGRFTNIRRIEVRYSDGRIVRFIPEAGREFFSRDDSGQLVKTLVAASSNAEWAQLGESQAD
jgi:hypothetical protein